MSEINKSKTVMIKPILSQEDQNLLIRTKYISKKDLDHEKSYYQYEKLKHNLKKKLREKIMDEFALKISENESKKNIYTFTSLNMKCDSRGLYHRLKKINQNENIPTKLKACFKNWFSKTPNTVIKHKVNTNSKNDRNRTIKIRCYRYQNTRCSNLAKKTTDMTTKRKRPKVQIKTTITPKIEEKPKYKYNYSCNNSKVSYSKSEMGNDDNNKGNIYIGKKNGNSYYYEKKYNNFGSLTIIQHNVENSKKNRNRIFKTGSCYFNNNLALPKSSRNKFINNNTNYESQKILGNSKSSWSIFCNSVSGRKAGENIENKEYLN
jgi:hypothetical protein